MNVKSFLQELKQKGRRNLTENEAMQILSKYGIKVVNGSVVKKFEEAVQIAEKVGYPIVLKIVSKDVLHKTNVGGVIVNINSSEELETAYNKLLKNAKSLNISLEGVFVQKMLKGYYEVIVGGKRDKVFGPTVMFGLGGIFVEVLEDISLRIAPIDLKEAVKMIEETKAVKILKGVRGEKANINEIAKTLTRVSRIMVENPEIAELDINPLMVKDEAIATDARIILF
ncbi:MAG: acetate--CoA ligase family protein [Candidatus Aenigmarchaeota archaeon]|nr:acetate--CoA ligase family protein [Candidatus Aenigmarchaeota archaeon]MCX8179270.1 acetate--CoA ligase family protein [Candidatus Aenigmarchaeota archaeon]